MPGWPDQKTWTEDEAIDALQDWMREHGRQPVFREFSPAPPGCPSRTTLQKLFGSWSKAIHAAGGIPLTQGVSTATRQVAADKETLKRLAAELHVPRAALLRAGMRVLAEMTPEEVRAVIAQLDGPTDGRFTTGARTVRRGTGYFPENEDDRPAGDGTAVEPAEKERTNEQPTYA